MLVAYRAPCAAWAIPAEFVLEFEAYGIEVTEIADAPPDDGTMIPPSTMGLLALETPRNLAKIGKETLQQ